MPDDTYVNPWGEDKPLAPEVSKLSQKKQELHALEVDIVKLRNVKSRKATLEKEIKKINRATSQRNYLGMSVVLGIVSLLLLASSIALFVFLSQNKSALLAANSEIEALKADVSEKEISLEKGKESFQTLYTDYEELRASRDNLFSRSLYVETNIGFIVPSDRKYYHAYGCDSLYAAGLSGEPRFGKSEEHWAHNTEYCEYLGYTACPDCIIELKGSFRFAYNIKNGSNSGQNAMEWLSELAENG